MMLAKIAVPFFLWFLIIELVLYAGSNDSIFFLILAIYFAWVMLIRLYPVFLEDYTEDSEDDEE